MTIGQLARETKVSVATVRFYARSGLLQMPPRPTQGYRSFSDADLDRLNFILRAKRIGFTLRQIGQLLRLADGGGSCAEVRRAANAQILDVSERIAELQRMRRALIQLARECINRGKAVNCTIIKALSGSPRGLRERSKT